MYFPLSMNGTGWEKSQNRRGLHFLKILNGNIQMPQENNYIL